MSETDLKVIGFLLALSGWGKVYYDFVTSRPKIKGQVFQVMHGVSDFGLGQNMAIFTTYLYLVNTRKSAIHILDYEFEVRTRDGWIRLKRVYGIHNIPNLTFGSDKGNIEIDEFSNNLIYRKGEPIEFGVPLHGWIMFAGDMSLRGAEIKAYRVRCIDAFGKQHSIITVPSKLGSIELLQDIANVRLPS